MNASISWDLYRSFLAVCDEQSLSAAARALGLTQPTLARHIDALEAALGCDLFVRSQRGLSPTRAALELRPLAETMAAASSALQRAASRQREEVSGTVRISASEIVGVEVLPPMLTALRRSHPSLVVELALSNAVENLLRRDADVAVRMVEPEQDALLARRIGAIPIGLYAHRNYVEEKGVPRSLDDLEAFDAIGFDAETPSIRAMLHRHDDLAMPKFAFRADSDLAQLATLRAGFGIGACQVPIARQNKDLVRVLESDFELALPVWIVMHEDLSSSPPCRAVFDALVDGMTAYIAA